MSSPQPLLSLRDLVKHYETGPLGSREVIHAVDGVSLDVVEGETLGLVGESGCGKSTLGRCMLRLEEPTGGQILFDGKDITSISERQLRPLRREMQMVFQDPYSSLNPRKRVGAIVGDVLRAHGQGSKREVADRVTSLLERVGLSGDHASRYPRQFSGGQRQRIGVARALALSPRLIVADEPVSALDVSVQAQVVNLLDEIQRELKLTYVFIAHDLGVVRQVSTRVGVMYLGKLVEIAPAETLYEAPVHPYTEALLSAVPVPDPDVQRRDRIVLAGEPPSPANPPSGCRFHTRCQYATEICTTEQPALVEHSGGRWAACHHPRNVSPTEPATVPAA